MVALVSSSTMATQEKRVTLSGLVNFTCSVHEETTLFGAPFGGKFVGHYFFAQNKALTELSLS